MNEEPLVWAFDLGKGSIGEAVRQGSNFLHKAALLIPADFAETKTAATRRRMWRTRQAHKAREEWLNGVMREAEIEVLHGRNYDKAGNWKPGEPADERLEREFAKRIASVGMSALAPTLNEAEKRERVECEEIIRRGWKTFLEVGRARATIRDKRLHQDRYGTFEEYWCQKWEFSKTKGGRLIEAAAVAAALTPIGVISKGDFQIRPHGGLAPLKIPAPWKTPEQIGRTGQASASAVGAGALVWTSVTCICRR
jgi:hypothetical protein